MDGICHMTCLKSAGGKRNERKMVCNGSGADSVTDAGRLQYHNSAQCHRYALTHSHRYTGPNTNTDADGDGNCFPVADSYRCAPHRDIKRQGKNGALDGIFVRRSTCRKSPAKAGLFCVLQCLRCAGIECSAIHPFPGYGLSTLSARLYRPAEGSQERKCSF